MNCHATRAVLDLRAEGRLTPPRAAAVDVHLASCAACRAASAASPATAPAPGKAAPVSFKARLSAAMKTRLPAAPAPAAPLTLLPRDAAGVAWAAAALVLVALAAGWNGAPTQSFDAGDELAGRLP